MAENLYPTDTKIIEIRGADVQKHTAVLRLKCKNKNEFINWLKKHQSLSGVTFRVQSSRNVDGKTVLYKGLYRCQHNTLPTHHGIKKPSKKHTDCQAKLSVTIKTSPDGRRVRSKDNFRKDYPTLVTVSHIHNHSINSSEAVKYKDPSEQVKNHFIDLFKSDHPPARALYLFKQGLLEQYEDDFSEVAADRSVCPDLQWVYRFYRKFKKELGNKKVDFRRNVEEFTSIIPKTEEENLYFNYIPTEDVDLKLNLQDLTSIDSKTEDETSQSSKTLGSWSEHFVIGTKDDIITEVTITSTENKTINGNNGDVIQLSYPACLENEKYHFLNQQKQLMTFVQF